VQATNLLNVARSALRPSRFAVMAKKVVRRLADDKGLLSAADNCKWLEQTGVEFAALAQQMDTALWQETAEFATRLEAQAAETLAKLGHTLGGGGFSALLYFLTRQRKPACVVETGVAAGYSSQTILSAMELNGRGILHSSDFPYFRLPNPERFVGILVDERLKHRWRLHIDGDEKNLPRILADVEQIDLFHYDSDKSYAGRQRSLSLVLPKCGPSALIVMDDIQDNSFFHDYVTREKIQNYRVLKCEKNFVGVIGHLEER